MPELAGHLKNQLSLLPEEAEVIVTELMGEIPYNNSYFRLGLVDPKDISERFSWLGDGKPLDILQLFFHIEEGQCDAKAFGDASMISASEERDGFEAGVLE